MKTLIILFLLLFLIGCKIKEVGNNIGYGQHTLMDNDTILPCRRIGIDTFNSVGYPDSQNKIYHNTPIGMKSVCETITVMYSAPFGRKALSDSTTGTDCNSVEGDTTKFGLKHLKGE